MRIEGKESIHKPGLEWRATLSIIAGLGWLIFIIIWLFFFSEEFTYNQNIAMILLSILVMAIILGIPWTIWGLRHQTEREKEMWKTKGFAWRIYFSTIVGFGFLIFLIFWFFYYADTYNVCQNLAILLVILLFIAAMLGASWAPWGIRYGHKFDEDQWKKKQKDEALAKKIDDIVEKRVREELEKLKRKEI